MAPHLGSAPASTSCRDRTAEFQSIAERLKKATPSTSNGDAGHRAAGGDRATSSAPAAGPQSEFNRRASRIGLSIHQTTQKLVKLAKLAKRTSMFDDPATEIQELTAVIKQDIASLTTQILELQAVQEARADGGGRSNKHISEHSETVVDNLKKRLMTTTKEFKDVLTRRTESLRQHKERREMFFPTPASSPGLRPPVPRGRAETRSSQPLPWPAANGESSPDAAQQLFPSLPSTRQWQGQGGPLQQELVAPAQDSYLASRADALRNVESTIVELSNIFKELTVMVQQQGEVAIRIDNDVEDTLANVEGAQGQLLRYLDRISSNRWLILKVFFVLIVFLLIFVFFVA